ncbi:MAG: SDR family oxidoreductase [Gammaproteobacteria bacterium]|nr:SDR family oxidoreductase [Gammaproteobacteria bacterium]NND54930.1 SDR family oxidoreductase [Gammaproteobacteria bacterium]
MDLKDKVIVITGAARGLGAAMARRLAGSGARLALVDLDAASVADTVAACEGQSPDVRAYGANVASEEQVVALFNDIVGDFGRLDGVVNNAGITKDALLIKYKDGELLSKMSMDQWQAVIDVNLTGVFLCGREAAEHMAKLGNGGCIINISSISRAGNVGQSNYTATKSGVAAMAVTWAKELARYGIRTGAVAPGFINTEMVAAMPDSAKEKIAGQVPLRRIGEPDEIAHAVQFILENDYVSGRVIEVDGALRL